MRYRLQNADRKVSVFKYEQGTIIHLEVTKAALLPMQIKNASADGFALWIQERAIKLNVFRHWQLAYEFIESRDKTAVAISGCFPLKKSSLKSKPLYL